MDCIGWICSNHPKCLQSLQNCLKWYNMVLKKGSKWSKFVQNCPKLSKMVPSGAHAYIATKKIYCIFSFKRLLTPMKTFFHDKNGTKELIHLIA